MSLYVGIDSNKAQLVAKNSTIETVTQIIFKYFLPKIGQIKFIYANKLTYVIDQYLGRTISPLPEGDKKFLTQPTNDFDGWVVADGQYYIKASEFPDAVAAFNGTEIAQIPNLIEQFVKPNPSPCTIAYDVCKTKADEHSHTLSADSIKYTPGILYNAFKTYVLGGYGDTGIMIKETDDGNKSAVNVNSSNFNEYWDTDNTDHLNEFPGFHGGSTNIGRDVPLSEDNDRVYQIPLTITAAADYSQFTTKMDGEKIPNSYPQHKTFIPIIFIGRKNT